MFYGFWTVPYEEEIKTLYLKRDPFRCGLGTYEDKDGKQWEINVLNGMGERKVVNAIPVGFYSQGNERLIWTYLPYYYEVVQ